MSDAAPQQPPLRCTIVVPCFDEEARLRPEPLRSLLEGAGVSLLLVDDGLRDGTLSILRGLSAEHSRVTVLALERNQGKAEAVRAGLRAALDDGADIVAYCDADLSTPPEEMLRLVGTLRNRPDLTVVLGARVSLLGREVRRSPSRHYLGRVFATLASMALRLRVYDTQCGAKVFRGGPALDRALVRPFGSRWAFDVELIGRLLAGGGGVAPVAPGELLEVPLLRWEDRGGSKLSGRAMAVSALSLLRVRANIRAAMADAPPTDPGRSPTAPAAGPGAGRHAEGGAAVAATEPSPR